MTLVAIMAFDDDFMAAVVDLAMNCAEVYLTLYPAQFFECLQRIRPSHYGLCLSAVGRDQIVEHKEVLVL